MVQIKENRYVVVAFDKFTGETFVSWEMLRENYDQATAEEVKKGLEQTMGELRQFCVVSYTQAKQILELERQQLESTRKNKRVIN